MPTSSRLFSQRLLCVALSTVGLPAFSAGFIVNGPGTPTPRPANPANNPWLNYPTHYGSGASVHNFSDAVSPDSLASMNRFMKLNETERLAVMRQGEQGALARGQALFNDARLGSSGLNCAACHPNGGTAGGKVGIGEHEVAIPSLQDVAQRYPSYKPLNDRVITQTEMQNNCVALFLKGKPLATGTREAADLTYYVGSFRRQP
jgi:cytochrome c